MAVLMGFIGVTLYTIRLTSNMSTTATTAVCNVSTSNRSWINIQYTQIRYWMIKLAFSLALGTFIIKIWRNYRMIKNVLNIFSYRVSV